MILGIGADLCNITRIERMLDLFGERFINRVFTHEERMRAESRSYKGQNTRASAYAKRFAAKEACVKALGTGLKMGINWREIGVINAPSGKPSLVLEGSALKQLLSMMPLGFFPTIHLTLVDEYPFAQAFVVIEVRNA